MFVSLFNQIGYCHDQESLNRKNSYIYEIKFHVKLIIFYYGPNQFLSFQISLDNPNYF